MQFPPLFRRQPMLARFGIIASIRLEKP